MWRKKGDEELALLSPIEYRLNSGKILIAETGFAYDGKSGPRLSDALIAPFGTRADHAWAFHDRGYYGHKILGETDWTRKEVDDGMKELLLFLGVEPVTVEVVYWAVRAGALESWETEAEKQHRLDVLASAAGED